MFSLRDNEMVRSTLIYAFAFALAGATPLVLLPVLTRELTVDEFGIVSSFLIFVVLVGNCAGLGANGYLPVRFFKDEPKQFGVNVWTAIISVAVTHLLALPLLLWSAILGFDTGLTLELLSLSVFIAFINAVNIIFLAISQAAGYPLRYLAIRALQSTIEISLCLLFLNYLFVDSQARIFSYSLAIVAAATLGYWYCNVSGYVVYRFRMPELRRLLRFGIPLMPHIIAGTAVLFAERAIILGILGTDALGIYMSAMQVGMAMLLVIEPVNKAFAPWLFRKLSSHSPAMRRRIVVSTYIFFAVLAAAGVILTLVSHAYFELIVGVEFHNAKSIVPFLVFGFVFQGMYYAVTNYVFFAEKTARLSLTTCSVSLVGAFLTVFFISRYGIQGAGVGFLLTNGLLFLSVWYLSASCVPMPWSLRKREQHG